MSNRFIIGVQFEEVGKIYYFDASRYPDLKPGDPVIVRTSRGLQLAHITQVDLNVEDLDLNGFKLIERPATPQDLLQRKALMIQEDEFKQSFCDHLVENGLSAVKVISAEFSLDGERLFVLINSESSVNVNVKRLHQDIKKLTKGVEVELRQIGPRDAAKQIKGMGACGMEKRCCSKFLTDFASISIRMAKTQDISLTPSEITGMCGRLRCCLMYEYDQYVEAIKTLPKRKRKVITPMGEGRVVQILPMRQAVIVDVPSLGPRQFTKQELDQAQRIANGEAVETLPAEESQTGDVISRPEDQVVDRGNKKPSSDQRKPSSKRRRRSKPRQSRQRNN